VKKPYTAWVSPETTAFARACARSFTASGAGRVSTVAHAAIKTATPARPHHKPATRDRKSIFSLPLMGARLFKIAKGVKQILSNFTTLLRLNNIAYSNPLNLNI
jgi:hypothetical protein